MTQQPEPQKHCIECGESLRAAMDAGGTDWFCSLKPCKNYGLLTMRWLEFPDTTKEPHVGHKIHNDSSPELVEPSKVSESKAMSVDKLLEPYEEHLYAWRFRNLIESVESHCAERERLARIDELNHLGLEKYAIPCSCAATIAHRSGNKVLILSDRIDELKYLQKSEPGKPEKGI